MAMAQGMECSLRAGFLKTLLECTKDLVTSSKFVFDEGGVVIQAMDSSHVSMISLVLEPSVFSSYLCTGESTICVHSEALAVVSKTCSTEDTITLE